MHRSRLQWIICYAIALAFILGVLKEVGALPVSGVPTLPDISGLRSMIKVALNTKLDLRVITDSAKGLGSFTARLDWGEVLRALIPVQLVIDPLKSRLQ